MDPHDHEVSGPPSPPPPAPDLERQPTGRHQAVTAERAERITVLPAGELTRRTLRAERIAEETRANFGRPEMRSADGTVTPATGFWKKVEPLLQLAELAEPLREMIEEWQTEREARKKGRGWLATRGEKLLDDLLRTAMLAIVALIGAFLAHLFHW